MMSGFIAVHVGAGYHGESLRPAYKKVCKQACRAATEMLQDGCDAVDAVTEAVSFLENCPLTNAGIGSNLSLAGTVECDAGIMDGASFDYGSVGALRNIKNPIQVAKKLVEVQKKGLLACGRIPPCTLVDKGALDWALYHGFKYTHMKDLLTKMSEKSFARNLHLLEMASLPVSDSSLSIDESEPSFKDELLDTVGAVCVDSFGNVSSAVSSGGLNMKHPGRLGQASIYGSGFWAQNSSEVNKPSVACSVSGAGEYLVKTMFAKECCDKLYEKYDCVSALQDVFKEKFLNSQYLRKIDYKIAGALTLKYYIQDNICEIDWAHNTRTMVLGYSSTKSRKPITQVSEQSRDNVSICGSGIILNG
ncbi:Threonine aspartase 1 like protein [Argiope bruennichi]|uniref:Threonine aspartase 1 like protein n=1 Tax=Argiope bruennichi TaxID=94029 RepID=A0A8T0F5U8_ARGBR|nr:Threonine aspartase 1 like protein [Argiope bruennichi]